MSSGLDEILGQIRRIQETIEQARRADWNSQSAPPEPEQEAEQIVWRDSRPVRPALLSLAEARAQVRDALDRVVSAATPGRFTLIQAQPGIGKTYYAVAAAQAAAAVGLRTLFLMPNKAHFEENIAGFDNFDPALWYHWRAYNVPDPDAPDQTMCKYSRATEAWMQKGYRLRAACEMLCPSYRSACPFRVQYGVPHPIIAGSHEHAVVGLPFKRKFDMAIIDELPTRAFLQPKKITLEMLMGTPNFATGAMPFNHLVRELAGMVQTAERGKPLRGKPLLDRLGPLLDDFYAQLDIKMLPAIPQLMTPEDAYRAPAWFILDVAHALATEWTAWERGDDDWLVKTIVHQGGVNLLLPRRVWADLPSRLVVLDATARADVYEALLGRKADVVAPVIERPGKLYQVATNYISKTASKRSPARFVDKWGRVAQAIIRQKGYTNPAVVTFQAVEQELGFWDSSHFYGQRGANKLSECDVLFVIGTPSPAHADLCDMATMLYGGVDDRPLAAQRVRHYRPFVYDNGRGTPYSLVTEYADPRLTSILQLHREDELVQAIHRARINIRKADVYLFSTVPTDERLDAFHVELPVGPEGVPPLLWLRAVECVMAWCADKADNAPLDSAELARRLDVDRSAVSRFKLLPLLAEELELQTDVIGSERRGRPRLSLIK